MLQALRMQKYSVCPIHLILGERCLKENAQLGEFDLDDIFFDDFTIQGMHRRFFFGYTLHSSLFSIVFFKSTIT